MNSKTNFNNVKLYSKSKKGKVLLWYAVSDFTLDTDGKITITIYYGQLGGCISSKIRKVNHGKNIGKSNETSVQQQAELEIGYLYQKQFDDGYVLDIADYVEPRRPQLAHKYNDRKHTVKWLPFVGPTTVLSELYYASRKLNGVRCFIFMKDGRVTKFESRTGKAFKYFDHLAIDLVGYKYLLNEDISEDQVILDGELFNKDIPFEILCSLINSDDYVEVLDPATGKTWTTNDVQFHCYDIIPLTKEPLNFYNRFVNYNGLPTSSNIIRVESEIVESEEAMIILAKEWIKDNYEGLMLRFGGAIYEFGKRSIYLLKFKIMEDEEFKIKSIYLAENDNQKVMFVLYNHHNLADENYSSFDCFIKGDKEVNLEYFNNQQYYINKWLTVQYQTLSKYNVPLFPVGLAIREGIEEDGKFRPLQ